MPIALTDNDGTDARISGQYVAYQARNSLFLFDITKNATTKIADASWMMGYFAVAQQSVTWIASDGTVVDKIPTATGRTIETATDVFVYDGKKVTCLKNDLFDDFPGGVDGGMVMLWGVEYGPDGKIIQPLRTQVFVAKPE